LSDQVTCSKSLSGGHAPEEEGYAESRGPLVWSNRNSAKEGGIAELVVCPPMVLKLRASNHDTPTYVSLERCLFELMKDEKC
jgi:hypothetical protein